MEEYNRLRNIRRKLIADEGSLNTPVIVDPLLIILKTELADCKKLITKAIVKQLKFFSMKYQPDILVTLANFFNDYANDCLIYFNEANQLQKTINEHLTAIDNQTLLPSTEALTVSKELKQFSEQLTKYINRLRNLSQHPIAYFVKQPQARLYITHYQSYRERGKKLYAIYMDYLKEFKDILSSNNNTLITQQQHLQPVKHDPSFWQMDNTPTKLISTATNSQSLQINYAEINTNSSHSSKEAIAIEEVLMQLEEAFLALTKLKNKCEHTQSNAYYSCEQSLESIVSLEKMINSELDEFPNNFELQIILEDLASIVKQLRTCIKVDEDIRDKLSELQREIADFKEGGKQLTAMTKS